MSGLTQLDNNFSVTCLSKDGWISGEPMYEKDNSLRIPVLKLGSNEYYYVDLVARQDNSFQINHIGARDYNFEDEENISYYDIENNIVIIPSLLNKHNYKKYSLELHKNNKGYYDVVNLVALD